MYKTILAVGLFCFGQAATAQIASVDIPKKQQPNGGQNGEELHNLVKLNIAALPLKNLSVQYEKILSKKTSVAISLRFMPQSAIPFKGIVRNWVGDDQDAQDLVDKSRVGNFAATPEFRFYVGKKGFGQGFYIAPYYRYVRFTTNTGIINYTATSGVKRSINIAGDMSAHNGGLMVGAQWFFNSTICLDWWIAGAHFGSGSGSFVGTPTQPLTPGEQADIKTTLDEIDIPLVNKTVAVNANRVNLNFDGAFGGLRGGLSIGIRF